MGGIAAKNCVKTSRMTKRVSSGDNDAPGHAQHGAFILFLKISLDQFLKEKLVAF